MLIRNKLILRFMLLVVAIQLCFSAFIYYFNAVSRQQKYYHRLEAKAQLMASLLIRRANLRDEMLRSFRRKDMMTMHDERISIYDVRRRLLYHIGDAPALASNVLYSKVLDKEKFVRFEEGKLETVGLRYPHAGQTYFLFVSGYDQFGNQQFRKLRLLLLVGNVGSLVLIIVAGWYFADESLKPIARVIRQVERITASNLSLRVDEGNQQDEIARLAITFNKMLSGVEQAFESQKSFLSHASHELRTPLTNLLGTLETSQAYDTDLAETKQSIGSAVEEIKRLVALTNGLLALAKADDTSFKRQPVRLDECLTQAMGYCETKYPGRTLKLEFGPLPKELDDAFTVQGNAHLLTTALFNILENACKYSQDAVTVQFGYAKDSILIIKVIDKGIGIAPQEQQRILEPLYRGENGKSMPGYGLGLAITHKVIQRHGGQLHLASRVGEGTTVTVRLPVPRNRMTVSDKA
ncbi:sensor histidine kinase [Hymenobacter jejuensis]|uniref:histidine kinase n=1 Tax=Hymenobacter jejuensis TaxID=2502781 RepID=A0A5B8A653_9BACT|nr:HAMP domain-containing sensor histidine kinase [Hymenobacter jejuensis]QDA61752.1 HAMP domain-containing histidine kinase [Hymenobacter jejuensis]